MKRLLAYSIGYSFGVAYIGFTWIRFSWLWFIVAVTLALSGCTPKLTGNIQADLHNDATVAAAKASTLATAGDTAASARVPCWAAWASITDSSGGQGGLIFTPVETALEVQGTLQGQACQAIAGQVLTQIVQKLPGL